MTTRKRDRLTTALLGPARCSPDEVAEQQVREWQQEAVKAIRDVFAQFRLHLDGNSAATAGELGHHELNQATTKWLALWADQERGIIADVQSNELANEAKGWILRRLEREKPDATDPPPKLAVYAEVVTETYRDTFGTKEAEAFFGDVLRRRTIENARAIAAVLPPRSGDDNRWSKPNGLTQWAKVFGFSPDTLKRRFKDGSIRHKKMSTKNYRIHVDDLPEIPTPPSSSKQK